MDINEMAEITQSSFDKFYRAQDSEQLYNNTYPLTNPKEENSVFNYWWLAHLIDARLDGFERTGNSAYLRQAEEVYRYSKKRNGGTLIHEYYDDMLWNALALLRFYEISKNKEFLNEAILIWADLVDTGWNDICGGGFAWKKTQLYYKNTPVNAPFIILSCRLYKITKNQEYLNWAHKTYDWTVKVLVNPETGFVEDGVNRQKDGKIDADWKFTYNQGVFIGANVELYHVTGDAAYLAQAEKTALATLSELSSEDGKAFDKETEGGDIGLFKGIFYRYAALLLKEASIPKLKSFIEESVKLLWNHCYEDGKLLPSGDWHSKADGKVDFSVFLSGIMAMEAYARSACN